MLICGEAAIIFPELTLLSMPPPPPLRSWVEGLLVRGENDSARLAARFAISGIPLLLALQMMLTPLLLAHLYLAMCNVTTREHFHWLQSARAMRGGAVPSFPMPGSQFWAQYAPYSKGVVANLASFVHGTRDEVKGAAVSPAMDGDATASNPLQLHEVGTERAYSM